MGMDTIELVMEIEDTFDVRIPDEDAERMQTPGDVTDWLVPVLQRRARPVGPGCLSQKAFHRLRNAFVAEMKVYRRAVRPNVRVTDLIPNPEVRARWKTFAEDHGLDRPCFSFFKRDEVPTSSTVRDLVKQAMRRNADRFCAADGRVDRILVLDEVRRLTAEQMAIHVEDVHEDSQFVRDLGMD